MPTVDGDQWRLRLRLLITFTLGMLFWSSKALRTPNSKYPITIKSAAAYGSGCTNPKYIEWYDPTVQGNVQPCMNQELFPINDEGRIRQAIAHVLTGPYRMRLVTIKPID